MGDALKWTFRNPILEVLVSNLVLIKFTYLSLLAFQDIVRVTTLAFRIKRLDCNNRAMSIDYAKQNLVDLNLAGTYGCYLAY